MFIFIGGLQPKTSTLDDTPKICPECGLYQMRRMRTDSYLSLFFIPVFRIKKGQEFYQCRSCKTITSDVLEPGNAHISQKACPNCGQTVEPSHRFCPHCGNELKRRGGTRPEKTA